MELLLATRSAHKVQEIRTILSGIPRLTVLDLDDIGLEWRDEEEALEPFDTFEENARSKAEYFHMRTGLPTVADDSGLEVDALGGAPGVRSKRFAPVIKQITIIWWSVWVPSNWRNEQVSMFVWLLFWDSHLR